MSVYGIREVFRYEGEGDRCRGMAAGAPGVSTAAVVLYWGYRPATLDGGSDETGDTSVRRGHVDRYIGHIRALWQTRMDTLEALASIH